MGSKGPRSKLDHETRARRQKALEAPREPPRPKAHWDHVLEEMAWLSKDFECERKWKLAQAKKVALRASKGMLDHAVRGEKKLKEEEQRMRKVALNIAKDVKKFWVKIEKLALYKQQLEVDEKKKKALDKQLEFLLGQTERYSTMLAENLADKEDKCFKVEPLHVEYNEVGSNGVVEVADGICPDSSTEDDDYCRKFDEQSEDDERTVDEDEAHITEDERKEELKLLQDEADLPIEELLKHYCQNIGSDVEADLGEGLNVEDNGISKDHISEVGSPIYSYSGRRCVNGDGLKIKKMNEANNGFLSPSIMAVVDDCRNGQVSINSDASDGASEDLMHSDDNNEKEDLDFVLAAEDEKDDETTLSEEEKLELADPNGYEDEIQLLQKDIDVPIDELLAMYKKESNGTISDGDSEYVSAESEIVFDSEIIEKADPEEHSSKIETLEPEVFVGLDETSNAGNGENRIADAAAAARSAQPTGNTFLTTKVITKFPFLLKYPLREYQHIGLDWLVTMYEKRLNGILADEMGLGKTIMTISLLAHLACEKGIWGPHLIVVPTSVMLNWETEFLKWCPAFKILTYFGSAKERKLKRQGWLKLNSFHVCITTYRLVIQDCKVFKRKKWKYLILDEAHLIKNWKSQRWQMLLNFNSKRRILLTGTPLQNDLMELWSLMHFLMPHIFQSHQEFKDWFSNPISGMVDGQERVNKEVVDRLHNVLRPFILRRLKRDVEKQLPMKHEHVIYCRLSRRQRNLYEDFIASSETQATLASANFFGMISVIMQLRKVCNHPDLFESRPIVSSFDMAGIDTQLNSSICSILSSSPFSAAVGLSEMGFMFTNFDYDMTSWEHDEVKILATPAELIKQHVLDCFGSSDSVIKFRTKASSKCIFEQVREALVEERLREANEKAAALAWWNSLRCNRKPVYSSTLRKLVTVLGPVDDTVEKKSNGTLLMTSSALVDIILSPVERFHAMMDIVESFMFSIPPVRAPEPTCWCSRHVKNVSWDITYREKCSEVLLPLFTPIRPAIVRRQVYFPDRRLVQFDCGKLQELAVLLRRLKSEGHRALIFTQMTKMLDILETFINLYGYTYMRLDGSTQPEERQTLMQRFNTNPKIFLFILSTRSGGVGINLVGADTVIFYDSDWNPAMDQQAQDRCHRIGQTREVHIYRLISESTIEENILRKANQKRALDDLVIQSGSYNTEFFKKLNPLELFSGHDSLNIKEVEDIDDKIEEDIVVSNADVEAALKYAEDEADYMALKRVEQEEAVENQEFTEDAMGKMDEDECGNDDDMKADEAMVHETVVSSKELSSTIDVNESKEEKALTLAGSEDDADMLADVREIAEAAAAAGQAISFENQLRPIDRYAIRFLETWDPVFEKATVESDAKFEETEWELDRIEKYKEEMEAEIDEDEEPFVYEMWDADFATKAYREQVEALAQHQLEEELLAEALEKEAECDANATTVAVQRSSKPKSKKKAKKTKFKSLKKGPLSSEIKHVKEEPYSEDMSCDEYTLSEEMGSPWVCIDKKYKKGRSPFDDDDDDEKSLKKSKKLRDTGVYGDLDQREKYDTYGDSPIIETKTLNRSKPGGKISITYMPVKRILTIKPEKIKKGNIWSRDCVPSPDMWSPQEDAILCAVVHEYGPHWHLASETLYGFTAGGIYRGRYRHPVHCCERYRELMQRFVLSSPENHPSDKASAIGSGKALLKVTEENIKMLLHIASEQPDPELLLQKHFTALLTSVWRVTTLLDYRISALRKNGSIGNDRFYRSDKQISVNYWSDSAKKIRYLNSEGSKKLLAAALCEANDITPVDTIPKRKQNDFPPVIDRLELTLEFPEDVFEGILVPHSIINLGLPLSDTTECTSSSMDNDNIKCSTALTETRFRESTRVYFESGVDSSFIDHAKLRLQTKSEPQGKRKACVSDFVKHAKRLKRNTSESDEAHRSNVEPTLPSFPTTSGSVDFLSGNDSIEIENHYKHFLDIEVFPDTGKHEHILLDSPSNIISGLDEYKIWPEFTDVG